MLTMRSLMFSVLVLGGGLVCCAAPSASGLLRLEQAAFSPAATQGRLIDKYQGQVLSAADGQLTIMFGTEQHTFSIAKDAKITLDGGPAKLAELKPGYEVSVTVEKQDVQRVAKIIEAKSLR